jgi:hypothetical protein
MRLNRWTRGSKELGRLADRDPEDLARNHERRKEASRALRGSRRFLFHT